MSDSFHHSPRDADIEAQAAGWVMRRDRGLTPGEQDEYLRWLAADPRHGEYFARHRQAWRRLDMLVQWRPEHSPQPNPDLLAPPRIRRRAVIVPLSMAAAAMVAWALFALWPQRSPTVAQDNPKPVIQGSAAIAQAYERRDLPDGSVIELNRGASVEWEFTPGERDVRLVQGEAQFTVAKNPSRPFVVTAGGVAVRAVGTAFDVKLSNREVEILVTEGRVRVVRESASRTPVKSGGGDEVLVAAGHQAFLSLATAAPPPRIAAVSTEQMEKYLAWLPAPLTYADTLLTFTDTPLSRIVDEFNRHNRVRLVVADPETGAIPITILSFHSNDAGGFARLLEAKFGVRADTAGEIITLRRDR